MARWLRVGLSALVTVLAFAGRADACSCMTPGPPCQAAWADDAVFVAQVVEIRNIPRPPSRSADSLPLLDKGRRVRLRVVEAFRGSAIGEVDVFTGAGGGDCGYEFQPNETYLIYARVSSDGRLTTGICSRTRLAADAGEDLAYLRGDARRDGVFSTVYGAAMAAAQEAGADPEPVPGVRVVLESKERRYEARTAADGRYSVALPPGTYRLSAETGNPGRVALPAWNEVTLRDRRSCAVADIGVRSNSRVTGILQHPAPRLVAACVALGSTRHAGMADSVHRRRDDG